MLRNLRRLQYYFFLISVYLCLCNISCGKKNASESVAEGKALAAKYCSNCHQLPDPALLDKSTWINGVLPAMAEQLGIEVLEGNIYLHNQQSALSSADWNKLVHYYQTLAPDTLQVSNGYKQTRDWAIFELKQSKVIPKAVSSTLLVAIDSSQHRIYTSNLENPGLYVSDNLELRKLVTKLSSPAIDICFPTQRKPEMTITSMGGMRALDITKGQILTLNEKPGAKSELISKDLTRPIQSQPIDFNKDGLQDYLVCAFGHNRGGLYLLKQLAGHKFEKVAVREMPGATESHIRDLNGDGWPDIITLFAHGDEGIWVFINNKQGGFTEKNVLRFPSVYGSSSFQLVDVTHDGKLDIIYTAGDNSDFSRILKPYHGLYIYEETGNFQFKQTHFFPINGCTKAIAADFDKDGDIDIATIAFFADFEKKPEEGFLYFEQNGLTPEKKTRFQPYAVPVHKHGRWICMDVEDYDGDGDEDIVLGNFSKGFLNKESLKPTWDVHAPYVLLENKTLPTKLK
ncbi:VCBS repeat-containing protein [Dyadobacter sp. CY107]|uniref:FG-GAP repeat domain-containing protein n=1 Tax=Dyadobacter fanqingshengii TaxID=2906443 RepID=UPI001F18F353|nr:VCBS repeat-containing protein [Dyadobacter fanqingshengii]MCF2503029.1 VCBS repeat-containing protein [Dyadobacter fanqingshengii]